MNRVVSVVRNYFRSAPRTGLRSLGTSPERRPVSGLIPVLLASEREDDHRDLQILLQNTKWSVVRASSLVEVSRFRGCSVSPVILVDSQFQSSDWRTTVASLLDSPTTQCIILLSDISDPYLWRELVQHGGFDILARPLDRHEVLQMFAFAHKHCGCDWPALHSVGRTRTSPTGRPR